MCNVATYVSHVATALQWQFHWLTFLSIFEKKRKKKKNPVKLVSALAASEPSGTRFPVVMSLNWTLFENKLQLQSNVVIINPAWVEWCQWAWKHMDLCVSVCVLEQHPGLVNHRINGSLLAGSQDLVNDVTGKRLGQRLHLSSAMWPLFIGGPRRQGMHQMFH